MLTPSNWCAIWSGGKHLQSQAITLKIVRDPQGHPVPEDGRIYSEHLHEQIGAELFIKQVIVLIAIVAFVVTKISILRWRNKTRELTLAKQLTPLSKTLRLKYVNQKIKQK